MFSTLLYGVQHMNLTVGALKKIRAFEADKLRYLRVTESKKTSEAWSAFYRRRKRDRQYTWKASGCQSVTERALSWFHGFQGHAQRTGEGHILHTVMRAQQYLEQPWSQSREAWANRPDRPHRRPRNGRPTERIESSLNRWNGDWKATALRREEWSRSRESYVAHAIAECNLNAGVD